MSLLRPRYAALAIVAFFAVIGYFAYDTARATTSPWYDSAASQVVYQTSLVGGVLLLAGMFVVASIRPRIPSVSTKKRGRRGASEDDDGPLREFDRSQAALTDADWEEVQAFLDSLPEARLPADVGLVRVQPSETPAVGAAGSVTGPGEPSSITLTNRLSAIRARNTVITYPQGKDTARVLSTLISEMRPLLSAARRMGLDGREIRRMIGEPLASEETDLAQRVRLVEHVKETVEATLVERIGEDLQDVLVGIQRVNDAAEHARAAELTAAEAVTLLDTGNYQAAIDRAERARETVRARSGAADALRSRTSGRSSWFALAGPAIGAVAYVAISAMLLPGYQGFLRVNYQLNTTAILVLSYGWAGLLTYALTSVYMTLRPATDKR